ncbi:hypothetical protein WJX72_005359 [[Myrmecia] bisecta]|uniref:Uncharacterized protein n=1 Tax=[Myrmecia] bisecta TaxID=41462 RepID=A0AAW1Q1T5_9CHLO
MSDSAVAQPSLMGGVIWSRVLEPRHGTSAQALAESAGPHSDDQAIHRSTGPRTTWQVAAVAEHPCAAAPIWQLSYSQASALDDLPLLAARTGHAMCIVQPGVSNERLHVQAVASARSRRRIMHWAWNPYLQQQGAFMGDDCSVTLFNLERNTLDCQPRTSFHQWQATEVAAELGAPPSAGRLVCEWAPHPTQLLTATGLRLARFDTRASEPAHTLHMRPEHDYLFALAVPGQAEDGPFDQMVAVSTARHILLLDLRRPQQPVLSWRHHQDSDPPHLLNFIPSWDLQAGQQLANKAQHPHSQPATPSLSPAQLAVGSGGGGAAEVAATQASQALHTPVSLQARDRTGPLPASSIIGASLASGQLLAYGISMCAASTGLQGSMLDSISASQLMRVVSAKQTPVTLWEVQHQLQVSATEVPSAVASDNQALLRSFYRQAVQGEAGQAARVRDVQAVLDQLLASKKRPRGHSHASQSGCPVTLRHQMVCLAGLQHRDLAREPEAAHAGPPSNCIPDSQQSMDVETSASPDQCGSLLVVPCDRLLGTGVVVHAQGNPPTVASPAPARRAIPGWAEDGGAVNQMTEGARTSLDLLRAKWTSPG